MENTEAVKEQKQISKKLKGANSDKIIIGSIIAICLIVAFGLFGVYYYNSTLKPIAKFDGGTLTISEYTVYYKLYAQYLAYYGYSEEEIPDEIAQQAALEKILLVEAQNAGMTISEEDKQEIDQMFEDEESVAQYEENGFDLVALRQVFYNNCVITDYIDKLEAEATDEEVTDYIKSTYGESADLNEYVTRHILIKTIDSSYNDLSDEEKEIARQKAQDLLTRALNGEDFEQLARDNSEDSTASDGGKYLMYMDGYTDDAYETAVKGLQVGQITTSLVESSYGYHIIKLDAINENGRVNNTTDRSAYVNKKIADMTQEKNLEINEDAVIKAVETITGRKITTTNNDTTNNTTVDDTTTAE